MGDCLYHGPCGSPCMRCEIERKENRSRGDLGVYDKDYGEAQKQMFDNERIIRRRGKLGKLKRKNKR